MLKEENKATDKLSEIPELDEISEIDFSERPVKNIHRVIQAEPIESEVTFRAQS